MFGTDIVSPPPVRGLFYSVLAHWIFLMATLMVHWNYWMPREDVRLITMQTQARQQEELLLPDLQPMSRPSAGSPAPRGNGPGDRKPGGAPPGRAAELKAVRGVAYQGPQIIVSNPPHPDNFRQTILQPDLKSAPKLPRPLPIPPMVSIAPSMPELVAPAPKPVPAAPPVAVLPLSVAQQLPKVEAPKLPLPESGEQHESLSAVASAPVPSALPKLARPAVPLAEEGSASHNILVVDAIPLANGKPSELPPGELHGAFTVAPSGSLVSTATGTAGGGTSATGAPGVGNGAGTVAGSYAGTGTNPGVGTGMATAAGAGAGTGTGAGVGTGTGHGTGTAGAGLGSGAGTGTGTGITAGNGLGNGAGNGSAGAGVAAGSGTGANAGTGSSPFPSIIIQGGSSGGSRTRTAVPTTAPAQHSYGITIVASGASGGGFKDYGVFKEGASYTVYLDMADAGLGSSWALQFAPDMNSGPGDPDPPVRGAVEPPYAIAKALPHISRDAAKRSHGATIIVLGVINTSGQWERLRILQGSDIALNQAVLDALKRWMFQPSKIGGASVPVKCLLGIPVNSLPVE